MSNDRVMDILRADHVLENFDGMVQCQEGDLIFCRPFGKLLVAKSVECEQCALYEKEGACLSVVFDGGSLCGAVEYEG